MGSFNRVVLIGHLGRDAEVRYTPGGQPVATLNLATSDVWTDKAGQRQERTEWHRVILWGKAAENLRDCLLKGKQVAVEGKLQTRAWLDKDGEKRYTTEVRADRVVLLGTAPKPSANGRHVSDEEIGRGDPTVPASELDDDVPF